MPSSVQALVAMNNNPEPPDRGRPAPPWGDPRRTWELQGDVEERTATRGWKRPSESGPKRLRETALDTQHPHLRILHHSQEQCLLGTPSKRQRCGSLSTEVRTEAHSEDTPGSPAAGSNNCPNQGGVVTEEGEQVHGELRQSIAPDAAMAAWEAHRQRLQETHDRRRHALGTSLVGSALTERGIPTLRGPRLAQRQERRRTPGALQERPCARRAGGGLELRPRGQHEWPGVQQELQAGGQKELQAGGQQELQAGGQQELQAGGQQELQAGGQQELQAGGQQELQAGGQQELQVGGQQEPAGGQQAHEAMEVEQGAGEQQELRAGGQQKLQAGGRQELQSGGQQELQEEGQQELQAGGQQELQAGGQQELHELEVEMEEPQEEARGELQVDITLVAKEVDHTITIITHRYIQYEDTFGGGASKHLSKFIKQHGGDNRMVVVEGIDSEGRQTSHKFELSETPIKKHKFGGTLADCEKLCTGFAKEIVARMKYRMWDLQQLGGAKLFQVESWPSRDDQRELKTLEWLAANDELFGGMLPAERLWARRRRGRRQGGQRAGGQPGVTGASEGVLQPGRQPGVTGAPHGALQPGEQLGAIGAPQREQQPGGQPGVTGAHQGALQPREQLGAIGAPQREQQPGGQPGVTGAHQGALQPREQLGAIGAPQREQQPGGQPGVTGAPLGVLQPGGQPGVTGAHQGALQPGEQLGAIGARQREQQPGGQPGVTGAPLGVLQPGGQPGVTGAHQGALQPGEQLGAIGARQREQQPGGLPGVTGAPQGALQPGEQLGMTGAPLGVLQPGGQPGVIGAPQGALQPGEQLGMTGAPRGVLQPGGQPGVTGAHQGALQPGEQLGAIGAPQREQQPGGQPGVTGAPQIEQQPGGESLDDREQQLEEWCRLLEFDTPMATAEESEADEEPPMQPSPCPRFPCDTCFHTFATRGAAANHMRVCRAAEAERRAQALGSTPSLVETDTQERQTPREFGDEAWAGVTSWEWEAFFSVEAVGGRTVRRIPQRARSGVLDTLCCVLKHLKSRPGDEAATLLLLAFPRLILAVPPKPGIGQKALIIERLGAFWEGRWRELFDSAMVAARPAVRPLAYTCSDQDPDAIRLSRCRSRCKVGEWSRGLACLTAGELARPSEAMVQSLREKHPASTSEVPQWVRDFTVDAPQRPPLTADILARTIHTAARASAAGPSGWVTEHLRDTFLTEPSCLSHLLEVFNQWVAGQVPERARPWLAASNLVGLSKPNGDVRPVAIGEVLPRILARALCISLRPTMASYFLPCNQLGAGTRAGVAILTHSFRSALATHPDWCALQIDVANAFNSFHRHAMFEGLRESPFSGLIPFLRVFYGTPSDLYLRAGPFVQSLESARGSRQGDPLGPFLFAFTQQHVMESVTREFRDLLFLSYANDTYILGPAARILEAFGVLRERLEWVGLEVQAHKCRFWEREGGDVERALPLGIFSTADVPGPDYAAASGGGGGLQGLG
ncbi:unnamed protein product [Closterium sp. NIES-64]|nr:unnamed protein product [Closterium sp. NIES-64]